MKWQMYIFVTQILAAGAWAEDRVDYASQIKPVLQARCFACHGALKQESGLRLDTAEFARRGGENGPAIKPNDAEASALLRRVTAADESERMPPEGEPLKPSEIVAFRTWIVQGAQAPADELPERDPRDHWSFRPPVRPAVPRVANESWLRNPIDSFIASEREKRGLTPQHPADKRIWLRRVSLDLIGLPPTIAELNAFLEDQSPEAYDRIVTRLLDSPHYGERWGRHWMDIWRYSDWWGLGAEVRNSQKHIWHWRDWIIESLNADKGYDQMLREMLAADELYPNDLDRLRASGFLARQYFKFNRTSWLDETIEHTGKAMLGLTLNCAKCHDHKYDPFSQVEYYGLRAIFEPYQVRTEAVPGVIDFEQDGIPRAFDCNLDAATFLHLRGDDRNPDKSRVIEPAFPAFLATGALGNAKIEPVVLPAEAVQPGLRAFVAATHLQLANQRIEAARAEFDAAKKTLSEIVQQQSPSLVNEDSVGPIARDDFTMARPDLWETRDGAWNYADRTLRQTQTGSKRAVLRLKQIPPAEFQAKLKYIPTGGDLWKSVGISFDVTESGNEVLTYLSSVARGPKAQVAYKLKGADFTYPAGGAQARPVELNQPHELTLRVRGSLINLAVDGEHSVAFRLPIPRQRGPLELITFDAQAQFVSFELSGLPESVALVAESESKPATRPLTVEQAKLAVNVAEKSMATANAEAKAIAARAAADRATLAQPEASQTQSLIAEAVRAERTAAVSKAEEEAVRAELDTLRATSEKKSAAEKKLVAAQTALEAARKALAEPGGTHTPLVGALKTLESNLEKEESRNKPFPTTSTGRRSALAKWLTDPRHPLPARVAVNHLWSRHFGQPLVPTVFDFGRKGTPPTYPELLDWLAVEFIEHGWSMKHMHRLIVTSATYRMSSSAVLPSTSAPDSRTIDRDNRFYWRANPLRMEAQLVRDSLLSLAGELDLTLGGPSIPASQNASRRRSLYFVHSHNEHQKFLSMFDDANVLDCYRRAESIVPQQALALENSALATEMAEKISQRLNDINPGASDEEYVRLAFQTVLAVEPTSAELALATEALEKFLQLSHRQKHTNPTQQARGNLILSLINHNDFVTVR